MTTVRRRNRAKETESLRSSSKQKYSAKEHVKEQTGLAFVALRGNHTDEFTAAFRHYSTSCLLVRNFLYAFTEVELPILVGDIYANATELATGKALETGIGISFGQDMVDAVSLPFLYRTAHY